MADAFEPAREFGRLAFQTLNAVVEPLVRAGLGGPLFTPFGAVVLEVKGRKSGEVRRNPLLATVLGNATIVATYRGERSEWVKNLAAARESAWWTNGTRHEGRAVVFAPKLAWPDEEAIPEVFRSCAETSWRALVASGWAVAVLVDERSTG